MQREIQVWVTISSKPSTDIDHPIPIQFMAPYWSLVIVDWLSCSDEKKYEPVIFFFSIPQPPPLLPSLQLKLQQQQKQQQQRTKDRERDRERERERERATYGCKPLGSRTQHLAPASGGSDRSLASLVHTFQLGGSSSLSLCILFFFHRVELSCCQIPILLLEKKIITLTTQSNPVEPVTTQ